MNKKLLFRMSVFMLISLSLAAGGCSKDKFLSSYMKGKNLNATVVIEDLKHGKRFVYNESRAAQRFSPASTFKIINSLIFIEEKLLTDEKQVIKWDGVKREYDDWNRDQSMETAFRSSCVWFYRKLASKIPPEKYYEYLKKFSYGNMQTGGGSDKFWLDGSLTISAVEQVRVMRNIHEKKYPVSGRSYEILKKIMLADKGGGFTLYGKTGWYTAETPATGWFAGYAETPGNVWFFACNLEVKSADDLKFRKEIIYAALRELAVIK